MSRTGRLFDLLHLLRRHRRPVAGQTLADELAISLRTLYRDIEALKAQGADIAGEAALLSRARRLDASISTSKSGCQSWAGEPGTGADR